MCTLPVLTLGIVEKVGEAFQGLSGGRVDGHRIMKCQVEAWAITAEGWST